MPTIPSEATSGTSASDYVELAIQTTQAVDRNALCHGVFNTHQCPVAALNKGQRYRAIVDLSLDIDVN